MSLEVAHHHFNAAESLAQALYHHQQAQKLFETGQHERASHHAVLAEAHQQYAAAYAAEAKKAYLNVYGVVRRAVSA